jgi:hypothetical protein
MEASESGSNGKESLQFAVCSLQPVWLAANCKLAGQLRREKRKQRHPERSEEPAFFLHAEQYLGRPAPFSAITPITRFAQLLNGFRSSANRQPSIAVLLAVNCKR